MVTKIFNYIHPHYSILKACSAKAFTFCGEGYRNIHYSVYLYNNKSMV